MSKVGCTYQTMWNDNFGLFIELFVLDLGADMEDGHMYRQLEGRYRRDTMGYVAYN